MLTCLLTAIAAPASAAPRKAHDDCNANDPDRNIAGCTIVAEDPKESIKTRAIAYVGRGLAWHDKGDDDRAMADFSEAIRIDPSNALAYNNRALSWRAKGDPARAVADFTAAIKIDPLPRSDLAGPGHVNIYSNRGLAWQAAGDLDRALADFDQAHPARPQGFRGLQPPRRRLAGQGRPRPRDRRLHQRHQGEPEIRRCLLQPRPGAARQGPISAAPSRISPT